MAASSEQVQEYLDGKIREVVALADARLRAAEERASQAAAQADLRVRVAEDVARQAAATSQQLRLELASRATPKSLKPPKPDKFAGEAKKTQAWTFSMEMYLTSAGMDEGAAGVNLAAAFFQGPVLVWWQVRRSKLRLPGSWTVLRQEITQQFGERNTKKHALHSPLELRQTTSARDYIDRFRMLLLDMGDLPGEQRVLMFIRGLKPRTRLQVDLQSPATLDRAADPADKVDVDIFDNGRCVDYVDPQGNEPEPMDLNMMQAKHTIAKACWRDYRVCFNCKGMGHIASGCPKRLQ